MVDTSGALYGTTQVGGTKNMGTIFKLAPAGSGYLESVLYAFRGGTRDGAFPLAALITDASGALYGTMSGGGDQNPSGGCSGATKIQGCGTVFKLVPSGTGYREKILYEFLGNGVGDGVGRTRASLPLRPELSTERRSTAARDSVTSSH